MKKVGSALLIFWMTVGSIHAQDTISECYIRTQGFESVSLSYFGEMITHPGLKAGVNYQLKSWINPKERKSQKKDHYIFNVKSILLGGSLGAFSHNRYQSGYFTILEPKYRTENMNGFFWELGLGGGYLRTITPSVYVENGNLSKKNFHNDYFISSMFISFGKKISRSKYVHLQWSVKPQFIYALPNFPSGVGYFGLELGVNYLFKGIQ